jgi:hypothetical protein
MSQRRGKTLIITDMRFARRDFSDGKSRAKIRYQIPLAQRLGCQGHSQIIVRGTRPYNPLTRSGQRVAFPLRDQRSFMSRPIQSWSPLHLLAQPLSDFLEQFRFTSAGAFAQHFGLSNPTIKDIIELDLGLRPCSRKWPSHSLSESQEPDQVAMA